MLILNNIKRAVRGEVKLTAAALEVWRRSRASLQERKERAGLTGNEPLALMNKFAGMSADELLAHFRGARQTKLFDIAILVEQDRAPLLASADRIVSDHSWPLLGFGEKCFGKDIEWTRDPLSNYLWPLDYHPDIRLMRNDGSTVRVLWE